MKKTLVVLLILAVAGGVFAQEVTWGGAVHGGVNVISGTSSDAKVGADDKAKDFMYAGGAMTRLRLNVDAQNDEGTFGANLRIESGDGFNGFAWWKPIDMVRLQIGSNSDWPFSFDNIVGWNFLQTASDVKVAYSGMSGADAAAFGGVGPNSASVLSIYPVDGLEIDVIVPFAPGKTGVGSANEHPGYGPLTTGDVGYGLTGFLYDKTRIRVVYTMDGLGSFLVGYKGGRGTIVSDYADYLINIDPTDPDTWDFKAEGNGGAIFAAADLSIVENLGLYFALKYTLPAKQDKVGTYNEPIAIGVGATYAVTDEFGVKLRTGVKLAGKVKADGGDSVNLPMEFGLDVLPYYAVSESLTAFLNAGFNFTAAEKKIGRDGSVMNWFLNPYVSISEGGGAFYAGLKLVGNGEVKYVGGGKKKSYVDWSIPIGIAYGF